MTVAWQPAPGGDHQESGPRDSHLADESSSLPQELSAEALRELEAEEGDGSVLERLAADAAIVRFLRDEGFAGARTERVRLELMAGAYQVVYGWVRSGKIFAVCARKGIRARRNDGDTAPWDDQDCEDLAVDAVLKGWELFAERGLRRGQWDPSRGASLATYFVGACLLQFNAVYNAWWRTRVMCCAIEAETINAEVEAGRARLIAQRSHPDPADLVALSDEAERELDRLPERLQPIVVRMAAGLSRAEAARELGMTEKAVERAFHRHRRAVANDPDRVVRADDKEQR